MLNNAIIFDETDLNRFFNDAVTRVEIGGNQQKRVKYINNLVAKMQVLSDDEIEKTIETLDALVEKFNQKKVMTTVDKNKIQKKDLDLSKKMII